MSTIDEVLATLTSELEVIDEQIENLTARRGHVQAAADALGELDVATRPTPNPPPVVERPSTPRAVRTGAKPKAGKVTRDQVLDTLRRATLPMSAVEVANALDADTKTVSNRLTWLAKSGHVSKPAAGLWAITDRTPAPLRSVPERSEPTPGPGAVPLGGPITRTPVNHDQARRAAGDSA